MELNISDFTGDFSNLNSITHLRLNRLELARHTMQVGYPNYSSYFHSNCYKKFQLLFTVLANVSQNGANLYLNEYFQLLDQSEKVCVSYQLGEGLAKCFSAKLLDTPWVSHLKSLTPSYNINLSGSRKIQKHNYAETGKEPDLIGWDSKGNLHILEAKGYSSGYTPSVVQKAIDQVSRVVSVNGTSPTTRVACFFDLSGDSIKGHIIDPPSDLISNNKDSDSGFILGLLDSYYFFIHARNQNALETFKLNHNTFYGVWFHLDHTAYFYGILDKYLDAITVFLTKENASGSYQELYHLLLSLQAEKPAKLVEYKNSFLSLHNAGKEEFYNEELNYSEHYSLGQDGILLYKK